MNGFRSALLVATVISTSIPYASDHGVMGLKRQKTRNIDTPAQLFYLYGNDVRPEDAIPFSMRYVDYSTMLFDLVGSGIDLMADPIPILGASQETLTRIIDCLDLMDENKFSDLKGYLKKLGEENPEAFVDLMLAANYMGITHNSHHLNLVKKCCKIWARHINQKPEVMKAYRDDTHHEIRRLNGRLSNDISNRCARMMWQFDEIRSMVAGSSLIDVLWNKMVSDDDCGDDYYFGIRFSPDKKLIAFRDSENGLRVLDISDTAKSSFISLPRSECFCTFLFAYDEGGRQCMMGLNKKGKGRIWDMSNGQVIGQRMLRHKKARPESFRDGEKACLAYFNNGKLYIEDFFSGKPLKAIDFFNENASCLFLDIAKIDDKMYIAASSRSAPRGPYDIKIYDLKESKWVQHLGGLYPTGLYGCNCPIIEVYFLPRGDTNKCRVLIQLNRTFMLNGFDGEIKEVVNGDNGCGLGKHFEMCDWHLNGKQYFIDDHNDPTGIVKINSDKNRINAIMAFSERMQFWGSSDGPNGEAYLALSYDDDRFRIVDVKRNLEIRRLFKQCATMEQIHLLKIIFDSEPTKDHRFDLRNTEHSYRKIFDSLEPQIREWISGLVDL